MLVASVTLSPFTYMTRRFHFHFPDLGIGEWLLGLQVSRMQIFVMFNTMTALIVYFTDVQWQTGIIWIGSAGFGLYASSRKGRWISRSISRFLMRIEELINSRKKPDEIKQNIFMESVKSHHEQICPHLEFKDVELEQFNTEVEFIKIKLANGEISCEKFDELKEKIKKNFQFTTETQE